MCNEEDNTLALIKKNIKSYPDFPKPGIVFMDIFSILGNAKLYAKLNNVILSRVRQLKIKPDCVAGLESRGFLFSPTISLDLEIPFVPIRKKGKLPGKLQSHTYTLEYGTDTLEIQEDSIPKGANVLLVDDLLATGGTMNAGCELINKIGANVSTIFVVMEITALNGRSNLSSCIPIESLIVC